MSVPNLIPHKTLCISGYICTCLAFLFTLDFSNTILKLILQFHASWFNVVQPIGERMRLIAQIRV